MRDNKKTPKGNTPSLNTLNTQLKSELMEMRMNLDSLASILVNFAGNSCFLENPEVKEINSMLDSEPTCDLDLYHKCVLGARVNNLTLVGCLQKLQEALGQ